METVQKTKKMNHYFASVNFYWFSGGEGTLKQDFYLLITNAELFFKNMLPE